jgi:hypothetical protein
MRRFLSIGLFVLIIIILAACEKEDTDGNVEEQFNNILDITEIIDHEATYVIYSYQETSSYHEDMLATIVSFCSNEEYVCYKNEMYDDTEEVFRDHIPRLEVFVDGVRYNMFYGDEITRVLDDITQNKGVDVVELFAYTRYGKVGDYDIISNPSTPVQWMESTFEYRGYIIKWGATYNDSADFTQIGVYAYKDGVTYDIETLLDNDEITMEEIVMYFPDFEKIDYS